MEDFAHVDHTVDTWPPWGLLALDPFMIENWDSHSHLSDCDRRLELVRQYVKKGSLGRKQFAEKAARGTVQPTDTQVTMILRPVRSTVLRHVADRLSTMRKGTIWLRTDYQDAERHKDFYESLLNLKTVDGEELYTESTILSDSRFYNFGSWKDVLDILPEIVVDHHKEQQVTPDTSRGGDFRQQLEREYMEYQPESDYEMDKEALAAQQHCCIARFLLVEDQEMHSTDPPRFHAVWLDDSGNVVRENRITAEEACDYMPMAEDGMGPEQEIWIEAEIGPKYVVGAEYGPPFSTANANTG